mgnify:CR=1 FL=1
MKYKINADTLGALQACAQDEEGNPLPCHGCGHSCGGGSFPNGPSGERPCFFCIRNVKREEWWAENPHLKELADKGKYTCFYNNAPMKKIPMDCYISTDRIVNSVPEGCHIIT